MKRIISLLMIMNLLLISIGCETQNVIRIKFNGENEDLVITKGKITITDQNEEFNAGVLEFKGNLPDKISYISESYYVQDGDHKIHFFSTESIDTTGEANLVLPKDLGTISGEPGILPKTFDNLYFELIIRTPEGEFSYTLPMEIE